MTDKVKRMNNTPLNLRTTKELKKLFQQASEIEDLSLSAWVKRTLKKEALELIRKQDLCSKAPYKVNRNAGEGERYESRSIS